MAKITTKDLCLIKFYCCEEFNISELEFLSNRRDKEFVKARIAANWIAKEFTLHSFPTIGGVFNRDHTTIIHSVSQAEKKMEKDPAFGESIIKIIGNMNLKKLGNEAFLVS
jgi:chromosomal replication initiator protein